MDLFKSDLNKRDYGTVAQTISKFKQGLQTGSDINEK